jgi:hypothetical protein
VVALYDRALPNLPAQRIIPGHPAEATAIITVPRLRHRCALPNPAIPASLSDAANTSLQGSECHLVVEVGDRRPERTAAPALERDRLIGAPRPEAVGVIPPDEERIPWALVVRLRRARLQSLRSGASDPRL